MALFPIRDSQRPERPPVVNWLLILANVAAFAWMLHACRTEEELKLFAERFGLVPAYTRELLARPRLLLDAPWPALRDGVLPYFTYQFVHGGWLHVLGNMWFLFIFGDNVEGRLGPRKYLVFYLVCGVLAGVLHVASVPPEGSWLVQPVAGYRSLLDVPMVGASGAIAGVLGAYALWFPRSRILTFFIIPIFLFELPAIVFLGIWFVFQFISARMASGDAQHMVPVAFWAHVGGFIAGAAFALMRPRRTSFD